MCVLIPGFARSVHCSAVYTRSQGSLVHWCRVGAREYLLAGRDAAQSRRGGLKAHRGHERSHVRSPSYYRPWSDLVGLTCYRPWYRTSPARIALDRSTSATHLIAVDTTLGDWLGEDLACVFRMFLPKTLWVPVACEDWEICEIWAKKIGLLDVKWNNDIDREVKFSRQNTVQVRSKNTAIGATIVTRWRTWVQSRQRGGRGASNGDLDPTWCKCLC